MLILIQRLLLRVLSRLPLPLAQEHQHEQHNAYDQTNQEKSEEEPLAKLDEPVVGHIYCLDSVDGAFLGFLKFGVQLELEMVEVVDVVWFALDVASWFAFIEATANDDPVGFILCAVVVDDETYFLGDFVSIAAAWFIDAFVSI